MPLHTWSAPAPVADLAARALSSCSSALSRAFVAAPHPVFELPLAELLAGGGIEAAQMVGWRYLVLDDDRAVGTIEIVASHLGDQPRLRCIESGPAADSTACVLAMAEQHPAIVRVSRVLGLLRVSSIHLQALWLRDADGEERLDRLALIAPAPEGAPTGRLIDARAFLRLARALGARERERAAASSVSWPDLDPE